MRSFDHPMEIIRREASVTTMFPGKNLKGFYDPRQKHGEPKLVYGDPEKFAQDLVKLRQRQERRLNQDWRWWIQKDMEDISYG